ncbi:MAG: hypothetical protein COW42_03250 [Deltaproteobacteria bacterium CG17_big_fil_post_rev_8_21_14_2_50_63_7]|nr:MAG: hypothetical protein COW42_03250 [Deltaproteobacteria bacterium CG17_big_fil_post_rev_8_21_14_2_50_63_7]
MMKRSTAIHEVTRHRSRRAVALGTWLFCWRLCGTPSTEAASPHQPSSNPSIGCAECHAAHGVDAVVAPEEQEALCKSCHNPTGLAASMDKVGSHSVAGGSRNLACTVCHNPHLAEVVFDARTGTSGDNLSLLRANVFDEASGGSSISVFLSSPQDLAHPQSSPPWDGVCQGCHTQTAHHSRDGTADHDHMNGSSCLACHPHEDGFLPNVDCNSCHDQSTGAHQRHLVASNMSEPLPCSECHTVPVAYDDPGHLNGVVEVGFAAGSRATWDASNPTWDGATCQDVFCHGASLTEGTKTAPLWSDTGVDCGWCHVARRSDLVCQNCHGIIYLPDDSLDFDRHINGALDFLW